jgi:hypothetical protein
MRTLLLILIVANLALFAYQAGVFGPVMQAGREPDRIAHQIDPDRLRVLSDAELRRLRESGKNVSTAPERRDSGAAACMELGDFAADVAARVQTRLAALNLGERLTAIDVDPTGGWYMVFLPPLASRAEAERVAEQLRGRGVRDLLVMESAGLRNAISLGSFKDRDLALKHQSDLESRGIKGARVTERATGNAARRFQIRSPDAATAQQLAVLQKEFAGTRLAQCAE